MTSTSALAGTPRRGVALLALTTTALTALALGPTPFAQASPSAVDNPADPNATSCVANGANLDCTVTYTFAGGEQQFVVPSGVSTTTVHAIGGSGGNYFGSGAGGRGAVVDATVAVSAGSTLYVEVGGNGATNIAGFNGGGGSDDSGGGGGATDLRTKTRSDNSSLPSRLLVAGGGGGADVSGNGGDAGLNGSSGTGSDAGGGGTQSAGGGGSYGSGSLGQGANGYAAGGGGYWGGGAGSSLAGGGGGSSLVPVGGTGGTDTARSGPRLTISYSLPITGITVPSTASTQAGAPSTVTTSYTDGIHTTSAGSAARLSITPNGGKTGAACTDTTCTATKVGTYTVTSKAGPYTATQQLTVTAGALKNLTVTPGFRSVSAGTPVTYSVTGTDDFGNPADVPSGTTYAYATSGGTSTACDGATCTPSDSGAYTVTATNGSATGTASLAVDLRATTSSLAVGDVDYGTTPAPTAAVLSGSSAAVGSVQFKLDGTNVGSNTPVHPDGSVTVPALGDLAAGSHTVSMTFNGRGFASSTAQARFLVNQLASTSSLTVEGATFGSTPTATAKVEGTLPSGSTVTFAQDGGAASDPVAIGNGGVVTVPSSLLQGLHAGLHSLTMTYAGDSNHAGSSTTRSFLVSKKATTTAVTSSANGLTATVTGSDPTGDVDFYVAGSKVATRTLQNGAATWTGSTSNASDTVVSAVYLGDADHESSSISNARRNPTITATPSTTGWSRGPVTITFACTAGSTPVTVCPAPVQIDGEGVTQPATKTVVTADGGVATVTPAAVRIDRTAPSVQLAGPQSGGVYNGQAPTASCLGTDTTSGIASCTTTTTGTFRTVVTKAVATDLAGNTSTATSTYRVRDLWVDGAQGNGASWTVKHGSSAVLHIVHNGRLTVFLPNGKQGTGKDAGLISNTQQRLVQVTAPRHRGDVRRYVLRFPDGTRRVVRVIAG